jgi:hypothetical protein
MLVLHALYSLEESLILWYNELCQQLVKLCLKLVEGLSCLYTSCWLVLLVYVDDIAMLFYRSNAYHHKSFESLLPYGHSAPHLR